MAPHTPGPWFASTGKHFAPKQTVACCSSGPAARDVLSNNDVASFEVEANARLIAAAPDLLAALKDLPNILAEVHREWDRGMKAGKLLIALMDPSLNYRADITAIHAAVAKAESEADAEEAEYRRQAEAHAIQELEYLRNSEGR